MPETAIRDPFLSAMRALSTLEPLTLWRETPGDSVGYRKRESRAAEIGYTRTYATPVPKSAITIQDQVVWLAVWPR